MALSIIIPAHNEESVIGRCIDSILKSDCADVGEIIISINGTTDRTRSASEHFARRISRRGWVLKIIDHHEPGKSNAINRAEQAACHSSRVYIDADITVSPKLLGAISTVLAKDSPVYATGKMTIVPPKGFISRSYLRVWEQTGFLAGRAQGAGLYATNDLGRHRWDDFPSIVSDDTFVRCNFSDEERVEVPHEFFWPLPEGFRNLVRARRRQDYGVKEVKALFPELNYGEKDSINIFSSRLLFSPVSFVIYALVVFIARFKSDGTWLRTR